MLDDLLAPIPIWTLSPHGGKRAYAWMTNNVPDFKLFYSGFLNFCVRLAARANDATVQDRRPEEGEIVEILRQYPGDSGNFIWAMDWYKVHNFAHFGETESFVRSARNSKCT